MYIKIYVILFNILVIKITLTGVSQYKKNIAGTLFFYSISSILLFKGLYLFEPDFFLFQNTHTFLYLSRDKTKG